MKRFLVIFLALNALFFTTAAQTPRTAQTPQAPPMVTASFDRDSVMIGDQFTLEVRVERDQMQVVDFPVIKAAEGTEGAEEEVAELMENVEVLSETPPELVEMDGRRQTIVKRYLLTAWREGNYNMGRFPALYADKNVVDTLLSADSLRIVVGTFEIDLATDKPYGVKRIPLKFGEIAGWLALGLLGAAVLAVVVWLLIKYRRKIPLLRGAAPKEPPHVEAIRRLEELRNQKLPQNGRHKQYYSTLVDILREYLEARLGIEAMEMTSAEILDAMDAPRREGVVDEKRYADLSAILHTADLVKFAKLTPEVGAAEGAWSDAYYFVEETKQTEPEE